jgi:hypothetical protein
MPRCRFIAALVAGGMLWVASAGLTVSAQTPPPLRLVSSNSIARLYWPTNAYYYLLQSTTNLAAANAWVNEASAALPVATDSSGSLGLASDVISNQFSIGLPKSSGNKFYRLKTPDGLPLCSFAVFYDGALEYSQCPTTIVFGQVHANGSIYVGTTGSATFYYPVTSSGALSAPFVDGLSSGWTPSNPATWNTSFNGTLPFMTNQSTLRLWNATNNYHTLIDIPPAGENPNTFPGDVRLYNQAQIVLVVTNDISGSGNPTVLLTLQAAINGYQPGADPAPVILLFTNASSASLNTNLPFLSLTNQFYDQREFKTNLVTDIDVGLFANWIQTNALVQGKLPAASGIYPTIFYVADRRNHLKLQLPVVRLTDGAQLPSNGGLGFSVATPNPLYVLGFYNVQTATSAANASAGTTNTTNTVPAALFSDALTILSPHWTDAFSYNAYFQQTQYQAVDDTINAAIFAGNMPTTGTTGTTFSGGIHNFPRLLEGWMFAKLWLNTSFCRLWTSQMATNQFRNPYGFNPAPLNPYYNPPTRHFAFDLNFLNPSKMPPGVPALVFGTNAP